MDVNEEKYTLQLSFAEYETIVKGRVRAKKINWAHRLKNTIETIENIDYKKHKEFDDQVRDLLLDLLSRLPVESEKGTV